MKRPTSQPTTQPTSQPTTQPTKKIHAAYTKTDSNTTPPATIAGAVLGSVLGVAILAFIYVSYKKRQENKMKAIDTNSDAGRVVITAEVSFIHLKYFVRCQTVYLPSAQPAVTIHLSLTYIRPNLCLVMLLTCAHSVYGTLYIYIPCACRLLT